MCNSIFVTIIVYIVSYKFNSICMREYFFVSFLDLLSLVKAKKREREKNNGKNQVGLRL